MAVVACSRHWQVTPSIYIYIYMYWQLKRCQHAQFLITTSFIVSRKLEILSSLAHIAPNKPVEKEITHFFQFTWNCFVEKVFIRTYELCDLDLVLLVQVHYCTMVVYLVGGLFLWAGFNASLILHLQIWNTPFADPPLADMRSSTRRYEILLSQIWDTPLADTPLADTPLADIPPFL